ncbi:MAG: alpha/beta hydrolase fold protein [Acidimicrobiales bacterium]|nr:alpha/beta hydrolase fold protein [Acidimicrobiales bacterium]
METVRSADGTELAYERDGEGPALVVVNGALSDRRGGAAVAGLLAAHFTVFRYDRRGRGDSGDAPTYAVEREVEDLAAVIGAAGDSAFVYGHSSGAVLALTAAAAGLPITRLVAYEPPYRVDGGGSPELRDDVVADVAAGNGAGAIKRFLTIAVGVPQEAVAAVEHWPDWPGMVAMAHTLPYDLAIVGDSTIPASLGAIAAPTLVLHGAETLDWLVEAMAPLVAAIPGATGKALAGQEHGVDPAVLLPELVAFLS